MSNVVSMRPQSTQNTSHDEYVPFNNPYELCNYVRKAIIDSKMKYKNIAGKAGVCTNTVSRLASGDTKDPHIRTVLRILQALGIRLYAK